MNEDAFFRRVTQALMGCQLVEQELKLYISEALDLVRKRLGERMPFKMSGDDFEDSALETLIKTFSKLTNNEQLVRDLRKFKDERNYLSHKGIAQCLDPYLELVDSATNEFRQRLVDIEAESERLRTLIHEEANNFRGFLWFENHPAPL